MVSPTCGHFLQFFCHFSNFTHNPCKALVDRKYKLWYFWWLFCIYIQCFLMNLLLENWIILEEIVFILVWWLRFPLGGGHFHTYRESMHQPWSDNIIYSSAYKLKALEPTNSTTPLWRQSAHQGCAGIGRQLLPLEVKY